MVPGFFLSQATGNNRKHGGQSGATLQSAFLYSASLHHRLLLKHNYVFTMYVYDTLSWPTSSPLSCDWNIFPKTIFGSSIFNKVVEYILKRLTRPLILTYCIKATYYNTLKYIEPSHMYTPMFT